MSDVRKAMTFATRCLKWANVSAAEDVRGTLICEGRKGSERKFHLDSSAELEALLREFLGERYCIQINRNKTGLFQWQVIVAQQGLTEPGARWDHASAEGEDLWNCIFDACVDAARMDKREFPTNAAGKMA